MCDPVSEIKCNIFGQVWFLKNLFFSNVYISVNMILECCYLFFGWEIGHLLSTYIASRMKGRPSKMCTGAYRGRGVDKSAIDTYVLNGLPQNNFVEYFLCIVSAKYTRASPPARKMSLFSSIVITITLSYAVIRM